MRRRRTAEAKHTRVTSFNDELETDDTLGGHHCENPLCSLPLTNPFTRYCEKSFCQFRRSLFLFNSSRKNDQTVTLPNLELLVSDAQYVIPKKKPAKKAIKKTAQVLSSTSSSLDATYETKQVTNKPSETSKRRELPHCNREDGAAKLGEKRRRIDKKSSRKKEEQPPIPTPRIQDVQAEVGTSKKHTQPTAAQTVKNMEISLVRLGSKPASTNSGGGRYVQSGNRPVSRSDGLSGSSQERNQPTVRRISASEYNSSRSGTSLQSSSASLSSTDQISKRRLIADAVDPPIISNMRKSGGRKMTRQENHNHPADPDRRDHTFYSSMGFSSTADHYLGYEDYRYRSGYQPRPRDHRPEWSEVPRSYQAYPDRGYIASHLQYAPVDRYPPPRYPPPFASDHGRILGVDDNGWQAHSATGNWQQWSSPHRHDYEFHRSSSERPLKDEKREVDQHFETEQSVNETLHSTDALQQRARHPVIRFPAFSKHDVFLVDTLSSFASYLPKAIGAITNETKNGRKLNWYIDYAKRVEDICHPHVKCEFLSERAILKIAGREWLAVDKTSTVDQYRFLLEKAYVHAKAWQKLILDARRVYGNAQRSITQNFIPGVSFSKLWHAINQGDHSRLPLNRHVWFYSGATMFHWSFWIDDIEIGSGSDESKTTAFQKACDDAMSFFMDVEIKEEKKWHDKRKTGPKSKKGSTAVQQHSQSAS